jgi:CDP-diacylglycerol--serine O-phosphatidyltransferase
MDIALLLIIIAAVCDFFDGFTARLLSISNDFGKQLDSLADIITFGVAPGVFMMFMIAVFVQNSQVPFIEIKDAPSFIQYQSQSWLNSLVHGIPNDFDASIKFLPLSALMIPFLSLFRLAKFNIDIRQTHSFIGIPTPLNTFFFLFFPLYFILNYHSWFEITSSWYGFIFNPYVVASICLIFPVLLVSEIPLLAIKFKNFNWKGNEGRFIMLISSALVIPIFLVWSIPIILLLFLLLSYLDITLFNKNERNEIQS